jgi:hypothetical protein
MRKRAERTCELHEACITAAIAASAGTTVCVCTLACTPFCGVACGVGLLKWTTLVAAGLLGGEGSACPDVACSPYGL